MSKRLFDIIASALGLIILAPVYLVIYIILKITTKGPAIFIQERIGLGGKPFNIYKFRTMIVNNEQNGIPQLAEANDDRLTPFGRWLRSHHLDELPQLWNVLKGDMSLVGPRPERRYFINQIMEHSHDYRLIYQMRPGLTSEATLYNGYTDTMEKMLRRLDMDVRYLENRTLMLDLKILLNTVYNVVSGKKF